MAAFTVHVSEGDAPPGSIAVRREVFIDEQGVTEREEIDGLDPGCVHFVAEQGGEAVGCASSAGPPNGHKSPAHCDCVKGVRQSHVNEASHQASGP